MKRKLLFLLCALLTSVGSWAGILDGWTKMETNVITNPENYYFIFLHTDKTFMLGVSTSALDNSSTPVSSSKLEYITYQWATEPAQDLRKVWTVEKSTHATYKTSSYVFRSLANVDGPANVHDGQWNLRADGNVHENSAADAAFNLIASSTHWNIQDASSTGNYWGAWKDKDYIDLRRVAGNKASNTEDASKDTKGYYDIYYMSRTDFNKKYQVFGGTNMNHVIVNRSFEYGNTTGWSTTKTTVTPKTNSDTKETNVDVNAHDGSYYVYLYNVWDGTGDGTLEQTVANLPSGRYSSKVYLCYDMNYVFNGTSADVWGTTQTPANTWTEVNVGNQNVTSGSTALSIRNYNGGGADDATLTYVPSAVSDIATAYTYGSTTEALKWYAVTIPSGGNYYRIRTSNAATLRYTTNGAALPAAATDAVIVSGGYTSYLFPAGSTVYLCTSVATKLGFKRIDGTDYTYKISNASFEGSYTVHSNPSADRAIYKPEGWDLTYSSGEGNDLTSLNDECLAWSNFAALAQANDGGNNVYWSRFRWGTASSLTLSQTISSLSAGFYTLIADGYSDNTSDATAKFDVTYEGGSTSMTFAKNAWCQLQTSFYLSDTRDVTIAYSYTKKSNTNDTHAGLDNVRLIYHGTVNADVTGLIKNPNAEDIGAAGENTDWSGSGRFVDTKEDWTGTTRGVFSSSMDDGYVRSQVITFPKMGMYRLDIYGLIASTTGLYGAKVIDEIGIVSEALQNYDCSLNRYIIGTDGNETATHKTSTTGWTKEPLYFYVNADNVDRTIYLYTSRAQGDTKSGYIGAVKLTYIGEDAGNLDFSEGAVTNGIKVCTYAHDVTTEGWVSGQQHMSGWIATYNKDKCTGGVMNVNSGTILGGDGGTVPTSGYDALSNGKVLGIEAVWDGTAQYKKYITLSAGNYTIAIPIYNNAGTTNFTKNLFGFVENDGTEHLASRTTYSVGEWTLETITLNLESETAGYLSLGYQSSGYGNANMPHLFVDRVIVADASANMAVNSTVQWGTFCAPFAVAIPSGVTAYTCTTVTNGQLDLAEQASPISANTPVILYAESGLDNTTFYGVKVANASDDLITGGLLRGNVSTTTMDVPDDGTAYLLQYNNEKAGFYKVSGSGRLIGKNRCYLVSTELGARESLFFGDDSETGINAIEAAAEEAGILKDGKYFKDGKIVIVKNGVKYSANGQIIK